jgi:hypothetical protein
MIKRIQVNHFLLKYFTVFILFVVILSVEGKSINIKVKHQPLADVLQNISEQSGLNIIYSDRIVNNCYVYSDLKNAGIEQALTDVLKDTPLGFRKTANNHIVLYVTSEMSLSGMVVDDLNMEALPNVNVEIYGMGGIATNKDGYFYFSHVPVRPNRIVAHNVGYETFSAVINPDTVKGYYVIHLRPTTYTSEKIDVYENSSIIEISGNTSQFSISPRNFSGLPFIGEKDIFHSLQLLPGIQSSSNGASNLYIRGGLPSENLVRFDGITLHHQDHFYGFYNAISADAVKDIQVYKGGFPARYGGKISGVVDITSKTGNLSVPRFKVGISQLSYNGLLELPLWGKGALLISGRRSYRNDILEPLFYDIMRSLPTVNLSSFNTSFGQNPEISFYDFMSKLTILPSKIDVVSVSYYLSHDNNQINYQQIPTFITPELSDSLNYYYINDKTATWKNQGVSFNWTKRWEKSFYTSFIASYSDYQSNQHYYIQDVYRFTDSYTGKEKIVKVERNNDQENNLANFDARFNASWSSIRNNKLEFGLDWYNTKLYYEESDNEWSIPFEQNDNSKQISVYIQDSWKITPKLNSVIGIRSVYDNLTRSQYWHPRLSLNYQSNPSLSFKAAWGIYRQFVLQTDGSIYTAGNYNNWVVAENVYFNPEYAEHRIIGFDYTFRDYLIDVEFFQKNIKNVAGELFYFSLNPNENIIPINNNSGYSRGIDLLIQKKTGLINGWISYSYNKTNIDADINGSKISFPMTHDKPHNLKIVLNSSYKKLKFSTVWIYSSGIPYSTPSVIDMSQQMGFPYWALNSPQAINDQRLPDIHHLDISISRRFNYSFIGGEVGLSLYNIYNKKNVWNRYFIVVDKNAHPIDIYSFGFKPFLYAQIIF